MEEILELEEDKNMRKGSKKNKFKKLFTSFILIIIFFFAIIVVLFNYLLSPVKESSEIVEFEVKEGSYVYSVGNDLLKEGLIKNELAYKIYVKVKNIKGYKAGIYKLDKSMGTKKIVNILTGDYYKTAGFNITFKEGITIKKIAKEIEKKTDYTEDDFYDKLKDEEYINELINTYWFLTDDIKNNDIYYPLEGYLYPETYNFPLNVKLEDIIKVMLDQTNLVLSKYKSEIDNSSYSIHQIITMASIIEKEAVYDNDKKMIASVFYNRLDSGMSLGSDVTTYYAFKIDLGERDLTSSELNTYNPYNTRGPSMNGKLPVGPISNFSKTSFEASLEPDESDYYYFVADKSGKTHFTKTYEEHKKVISELKKANNWIEF